MIAAGQNCESQHGDLARARQSRGQSIFPVVIATGIVYASVVGITMHRYGDNFSSLVGIGQSALGQKPGLLGHHVIVFRDSAGYDGQIFYAVADNPFLRQRAYPDVFRYQRIGYPLAIWATSLGRRDWRPAAMVSANLFAVLAVAYQSCAILRLFGMGASVWWAIACAINPSLLIGVQLDLGEPMATALALAGLLLYLQQRAVLAALVLAVVLLTRETAALFLIPVLVTELVARRLLTALLLGAAVLPYLVWQRFLANVLGQAGVPGSETNFGAPLAGIKAMLAAMRHESLRRAIVHEGSALAVVGLMLGTLVVGLLEVRRNHSVMAGSMMLHAAASLFAGSSIWLAYTSAARVLGGVNPVTVFGFTRHRIFVLCLLVAGSMLLALFTIIRPVVITPAVPYYVTP